MRSSSRLVIAAAVAALGLGGAPALAQDAACKAPFERAQELRAEGHLVLARVELTSCAAKCPQALAEQCQIWIGEVEPQIGRLVVVVTGDKGQSADTATVELDGKPVPREVWTNAIAVDPGAHAVRVSTGANVDARTVKVAAGATERLTFALNLGGPTEPTTPGGNGRGDLGWLLLGAGGLAATLGGTAVAVAGQVLAGDYAQRCQMLRDPECSEMGAAAWRTQVERLWVAGGVVSGLGVAAMGVALVGRLLESKNPSKATAPATTRSAGSVLLVPHAGGLGIDVRF